MVIAFDNKTDSGNIVISPFTFSHVCTGSQLALIVCIAYADNNPSAISAVSYNGVAMARAVINSVNFVGAEMWYLANPATGSNTVSITGGNNLSGCAAIALSFTGVDSSVLDGTNGSNGNSTSISTSLTTNIANSWVVDCASVNNNGSSPITISVNASQTQRSNTTNGTTSTRGSSNKTTPTSPGANTMSWTINTSLPWAQTIIGLKAYVLPRSSAFLMFM